MPGAGCTPVNARKVTCSAAGVTSVHADTGDGNDTVQNGTATPATLDGGPGR